MAKFPTNVYSLEEEYKTNPQLKPSDVQILREWCNKQGHLPNVDDVYLALFLHSNYYQLEPTKNTIENFYTVRTHVPEFFSQRDPLLKEVREQLHLVYQIPLKERTKEGYQIFVNKIRDPNSSLYYFHNATKSYLMSSELTAIQVGPTNGIVFVVDTTNFTMAHISRFNIMGLKKFLFYIQEAIPVRLKFIYLLNCNPAVETILNMTKPFMKKKLIDMIQFHTLTSLGKIMDIDVLPSDFGGKAATSAEMLQEQLKNVDENREWFLWEEATMRVNESLRVGKPKSSDELFGVEGSFRKLDID